VLVNLVPAVSQKTHLRVLSWGQTKYFLETCQRTYCICCAATNSLLLYTQWHFNFDSSCL